MSLVTYNAETGSNGTALTTGNSGSTNVVPGTGSITFATAAAYRGSLGYQLAMANGSQCALRFPAATSTNLSATYSCYLQWATGAAGNRAAISLRYSAGFIIRLTYNASTGALSCQSANNTGTTLFTTTETYSTGVWYRFAITVTVATSTTGSYTIHSYIGDSTTPYGTYTSTSANLGTAAFVSVDHGDTANTAGATTLYFDEIKMNDGSTTEIGPSATTQGLLLMF